ncbi:MAG: hypothetical protein KHY83_01305 [Coriobacteriia bacterium]|nr:hypothetical protein [Coriobacteriia bacterium]MBS5477287.1 hypothetical protein [Coriobacteriia bacterium]
MPVLMNKGADPHQAAWLFFTARPTLDELCDAIQQQRFDAGRLAVDEDELAGAKKANAEVSVYLDVTSVVPQDFDLEGALEKARAQAEAQASEEDSEDGDAPAQEDDAPESGADEKPALPYEPVALDEPIRVVVGTTTAQAARSYLTERTADGEDRDPTELPGLQALAQLIDHMRASSFGLPAHAVWHVDAQGILRMAPAKSVKPMAGNVLKVKL